jgi:DNA-binding ferritin-like protein
MNPKFYQAPPGQNALAVPPRSVVTALRPVGAGLAAALRRCRPSDPPRVTAEPSAVARAPAANDAGPVHTIKPADKPEICNLLNQCLSDCLDLQSQCRQALWHLRASECAEPRFVCAQAVQLIGRHVDYVGYRIGELGGATEGTAAQVAERSGLCEYPATATEAQVHIDAIAFAFWLVGAALREDAGRIAALGDAVSLQLLTQIIALMARLRAQLEEDASATAPVWVLDP